MAVASSESHVLGLACFIRLAVKGLPYVTVDDSRIYNNSSSGTGYAEMEESVGRIVAMPRATLDFVTKYGPEMMFSDCDTDIECVYMPASVGEDINWSRGNAGFLFYNWTNGEVFSPENYKVAQVRWKKSILWRRDT